METIKLKDVVMEDFCNYRKPSMFLITCFCDWKCCLEGGYDISVCQNSGLKTLPIKEFGIDEIYDAYRANDITSAIVIGGFEPMLQSGEIFSLIKHFRDNGCLDDFVIYTGYREDEVKSSADWSKLLEFDNIVVKFGRYVANSESHRDEVLGIVLSSSNQYGKEFNRR